jgi:hypothetical protein
MEEPHNCDPLNNACFATRAAELWDPDCSADGSWTLLTSQVYPRMYHSTATLVPDGRVLSTGGGHRTLAIPGPSIDEQPTAEYFVPLYGGGLPPAFEILEGGVPNPSPDPIYLPYEDEFELEQTSGPEIAAVNLVRLGSVTHGFDQGQMFIPLTLMGESPLYTVETPHSTSGFPASALAPPGFYMVFAVSITGTISDGRYVRLGTPDELLGRASPDWTW